MPEIQLHSTPNAKYLRSNWLLMVEGHDFGLPEFDQLLQLHWIDVCFFLGGGLGRMWKPFLMLLSRWFCSPQSRQRRRRSKNPAPSCEYWSCFRTWLDWKHLQHIGLGNSVHSSPVIPTGPLVLFSLPLCFYSVVEVGFISTTRVFIRWHSQGYDYTHSCLFWV
jgi:hypothetical protein